jgi:hypothetical protein
MMVAFGLHSEKIQAVVMILLAEIPSRRLDRLCLQATHVVQK